MANQISVVYSQNGSNAGVAVTPASPGSANSATFTVHPTGSGNYWYGCDYGPFPFAQTANSGGPVPTGNSWTQGPDSPLTPNALGWFPKYSSDGENWTYYLGNFAPPTQNLKTGVWTATYTNSDGSANITVMIQGGGGEPE